MSVVGIIALVVVGLLAVLFVTGLLLGNRRQARFEDRYRDRVAQANRHLAAAHAEDNGWAPATVEAAAREAFGAAHPGAPVDDISLVQVIDPPGTDDDQAIFKVLSDGEEHTITLGRRDGRWLAV